MEFMKHSDRFFPPEDKSLDGFRVTHEVWHAVLWRTLLTVKKLTSNNPSTSFIRV